MISIRGGSGLGDAIYLQAVARHFVGKGHQVEACSDWPDVFRPLGAAVRVSPFRRHPVDRNAHYSMRRSVAGTTQFEDCCIQAGITEPVEFKLDWRQYKQGQLSGPINWLPCDMPVVLVSMPRAPFGRDDGFGVEFLPNCRRIQEAIDALRGRALIVQIGKGEAAFEFSGIDIDLVNKTDVSDLLTFASLASGFLGFCSYIVPLAEALERPAFLVWSSKGLRSRHEVVRLMTPQKILHRRTSRYVIDDCSSDHLRSKLEAFYREIRSPALV